MKFIRVGNSRWVNVDHIIQAYREYKGTTAGGVKTYKLLLFLIEGDGGYMEVETAFEGPVLKALGISL